MGLHPGIIVVLAAVASLLRGRYALDHLFAKLLKLEGTMQTPAGKAEASRRTRFLRQFLAQLHDEIGAPDPGSEDLVESAPDGA